MKIAFFASEVAPYAKTGGLADVTGALPRYLAKLGLEVKVFLPLYRDVRRAGTPLLKAADRLSIDWAGHQEIFSVWESLEGGASVYFIDKPALYDREGLYGTAAGDFPDNGERFAFFSRAALETLKQLGFAPDILHVHDWQASIALAFLKCPPLADDPFYKDIRTLTTIHNLAYQGLFEKDILRTAGLPESLFDPAGVEFYGKVNFLKAGIVFASALSTVSHRYSLEIQTPELGCGLDGLLRSRADVLTGILNGVDYAAWNPATDASIAAHYSPSDVTGKAACKKAALEAFGLPLSKNNLPLVGMVSRLAGQKGIDILVDALGGLMASGMKLVILGTGEESIQRSLEAAAGRYPSFLGLKIGFDDRLAHTIIAGSDIFLIPSRYEPCGLTQMYSLKYGTIPVVRATGGLDDSISEFEPVEGQGNGFKFDSATPQALTDGVRRAVRTYAQKRLWARLVQNAMACDFSWERTAQEYQLLYSSLRNA
jgi:starch synthase